MNMVPTIANETAIKEKRGRGRPVGSINKVQQLARENLTALFDQMGGVDGMFEWVNQNDKNKYAFYVYIYPKILGVQGVQRPSGPVITKVTNVIVDSKSGYKGPIIDSESVEVINPPRDRRQDEEFEAIEAGRPELVEGEMPL